MLLICQSYWDDFFAQRKTLAFEWYGEFSDLKRLLSKCMTKKERILNVGCGNSDLSTQMYADGYTTIHNVDFSEAVIEEMKKKTHNMPGLEFTVMDMTKMSYAAGSFEAVIDKV